MKSSYFITIFLLLLLLLQACTHDPFIINEPIVPSDPCPNPIPISLPVDTCFEFSFNMPNGPEYEITGEDLRFAFPRRKPNQDETFLYYRYENIDGNIKRELVKNNFCLQDPAVIYPDFEFYISHNAFEWGSNNWLLFGTINQEIWAMKYNGDSLYQIPINRDCFYPNWYNEELIYCTCRFPEIPEQFLRIQV